MACSLVLVAVLLLLPECCSFATNAYRRLGQGWSEGKLRSTVVEPPPLYRTSSKGTIYVLFLDDARFYVGKTVRDPEERLREHFYGDAAHWTRQYKPKHRLQPLTSIEDDLESW
jgi:hypothetical protein